MRTNGKSPANVGGNLKAKSNGNILNFFKKAESTPSNGVEPNHEDEDLFIADSTPSKSTQLVTQTPTPPSDHPVVRLSLEKLADASNVLEESRFNELNLPTKRRRIQERADDSSSSNTVPEQASVSNGPFVDDSDSDEDGISQDFERHSDHSRTSVIDDKEDTVADDQLHSPTPNDVKPERTATPLSLDPVPHLKREPTSYIDENEFDEIEDFIDEFPEEGEEYIERKWMEEHSQIEMGMEDDMELEQDMMEPQGHENGSQIEVQPADAVAASCPICGGTFSGLTEQDASKHVNDCLDGKAQPLPNPTVLIKMESESIKTAVKTATLNHKRFQRATIARPGQQNPFELGSSGAAGSSAFSKLMSGHAEDAAWATAAASEAASRGKPAYQRTCPFYKILPGFFICVDAFRYGAVEGCKAYFLSHFHSDHYIGLTSSWSYGPIYCSHVTANLVRRQLRVDPKWVVDLEFDKKIEVPGTQGVEVTMIPANHCPGSSLFLYEKIIGKGKNPKIQRVLHCGDFRACPAHVQHPLLRPDVVDTVAGKITAHQKLDVCYLDTTYLTPKYAFPSQEQVIKACADMCVSLSKDKVDENDSWEQTKRERAGTGMVKFVKQGSDLLEQQVGENDDEDEKTSKKSADRRRGRLLVIVGTYSIGKERICLGVARALNSKIYAPPNKQKVVAALEDAELSSRMTDDPLEAQVHMQMLMEIRAETLADYLTGYRPHFSRIVGFRPSGWNYRPPNSRFVESPAVQTVLYSDNWKSGYSMADLVPQRGSSREASCFGVPYSEHSSFRELTMFCCALRIDKIIPTVNIGSAKSREKMKGWCEKWAMEKKKNGLFKVADGQTAW